MKINDEKIGKFDTRVDEGIFLGYSHNKNGYRCYNQVNKRIIYGIDVKVYEHNDQEVKQPEKSSVDEPISIGDENDEETAEESDEYPSSPQARDPPLYEQNAI